MSSSSSGHAARSLRGRRGSRPSGDDRELAILETAERLLGERPLREIAIDELAKGAGISRPTFYFYFASKDAVLLALLDRVAAEADAACTQIAERPGEDLTPPWREVIAAFYRIFSAHRSVAVAAAQGRASSPRVSELWASVMANWVRRTAEAIQAERDRGAAEGGPPAEELAIVLNQLNERAMYASFTGEHPSVAEARVVDVLLEVWLSAIYHRPTGPASATG